MGGNPVGIFAAESFSPSEAQARPALADLDHGQNLSRSIGLVRRLKKQIGHTPFPALPSLQGAVRVAEGDLRGGRELLPADLGGDNRAGDDVVVALADDGQRFDTPLGVQNGRI